MAAGNVMSPTVILADLPGKSLRFPAASGTSPLEVSHPCGTGVVGVIGFRYSVLTMNFTWHVRV